MATRRAFKGVLHNFLGTYTSRYSDYDGYWVFGLIEEYLDGFRMDLLGSTEALQGGPQLAQAVKIAREKFAEQLGKERFPNSWVREAKLEIIRSNTLSKKSTLNACHTRFHNGHDYIFTARLVTDMGGTYNAECRTFIAPHDPSREHRSIRRIGFIPKIASALRNFSNPKK